jgi:hypothetical protein
MMNQPTFEKLVQMRMSAMADAYRQQEEDPAAAGLPFEERMGFLVDAEYWSRHNNRLKRNIHKAMLDQPQASLSDINYTSVRLLNRNLIQSLVTFGNSTISSFSAPPAAGKHISPALSAWRPAGRALPCAAQGFRSFWRN